MMMRVTVHYMAQIKRAAGCSSEMAPLPDDAVLRDLLILLGDRHGSPLRALLLDDLAQPRRSLLFFVADEHAGPTHPLRDGDEVTILAPMSGG